MSKFMAQKMAVSLFEHIKHGDEKHQSWLKEAALEWSTKWMKENPLPDIQRIKDVCRATGLVTNRQALELAEAIAALLSGKEVGNE